MTLPCSLRTGPEKTGDAVWPIEKILVARGVGASEDFSLLVPHEPPHIMTGYTSGPTSTC